MDPADQIKKTEKKIQSLEQDLNDLRQGLTLVADYCRGLEGMSRRQVAMEKMDQTLVKPLLEEDLEFESIWKFHEEVLAADPEAHVPFEIMYEAFVRYCESRGRGIVDREAFEFVLARIENPAPIVAADGWVGYRLRPAGP